MLPRSCTSVSQHPPRFSRELERSIFASVAKNALYHGEYRQVVDLLLISRRVYVWIKPFLYHTLMQFMPASPNRQAFSRQNRQFTCDETYRDTKNIMMQLYFHEEVLDTIARCPVAEDVQICLGHRSVGPFLGLSVGWLETLQARPIRRLAIPFSLFSWVLNRPDLPSLNIQKAFPCLTHLSLRTMPVIVTGEGDFWEAITQLTTLTHISISRASTIAIKLLLSRLPSLQLLCLEAFSEADSKRFLSALGEIQDSRIVLTRFLSMESMLQQWEAGTRGHPDCWDKMEWMREKNLPLNEQHSLLFKK